MAPSYLIIFLVFSHEPSHLNRRGSCWKWRLSPPVATRTRWIQSLGVSWRRQSAPAPADKSWFCRKPRKRIGRRPPSAPSEWRRWRCGSRRGHLGQAEREKCNNSICFFSTQYAIKLDAKGVFYIFYMKFNQGFMSIGWSGVPILCSRVAMLRGSIVWGAAPYRLTDFAIKI